MSDRRDRIQDASIPVQLIARAGGALYLVIIVIGLLGEVVVRGSLIVPGNAAATAQRILASEFLWRLGVAGQLVLLICATALTLVFYLLLRPVSKTIALAAVFFAIVSLAVESVSALFLQQVLPPLLGEGAFCLWLLFKDVDLPAWEGRTQAVGALSEPLLPGGRSVQPE